MKKLLSCCLLFLTLFSSANADPIRLVTSGNFLPFTGEDWRNRGMITEIVDRVMRGAGLEHEVVFQPTWSTLLDDTEAGVYQATFPWYYNDERAKRFLYSDSLMSNYIVPFVLTDSHVRALEPEALAGHHFCRPQGYFTHDLTELLEKPGSKLTMAETLDECFRLLKAGEVDVVPVDIFSSRGAIHRVFDDPNAVRRLTFVFSRQHLHILVPKNAEGAQELVDRINIAIGKLELRGMLQSIRDIHASKFLRQYE